MHPADCLYLEQPIEWILRGRADNDDDSGQLDLMATADCFIWTGRVDHTPNAEVNDGVFHNGGSLMGADNQLLRVPDGSNLCRACVLEQIPSADVPTSLRTDRTGKSHGLGHSNHMNGDGFVRWLAR